MAVKAVRGNGKEQKMAMDWWGVHFPILSGIEVSDFVAIGQAAENYEIRGEIFSGSGSDGAEVIFEVQLIQNGSPDGEPFEFKVVSPNAKKYAIEGDVDGVYVTLKSTTLQSGAAGFTCYPKGNDRDVRKLK